MHVSAFMEEDTMEGAGRRLVGVDLEPGDMVGAYVIDYLCATGGFADVYRAHGPDGDVVALKILHRHLVQRARLVARFLQEAEALARLDHPNIVTVQRLGRLADGRPYFVMEWLGERTLRDFLRQHGPLSSSEVVSLVADVAAGLGEAHGAGIVHRDLKSKNIMVPETGGWVTAKLIDFGIAKLTEPERFGLAGLISTNTVVGTPTCMAPEQILGHRADARTDIYALGVLIYELLTGDPPFCGDSRVELEEMHLNAPPPRVSAVAPVPAALDDVVAKCLEKDPDRRYASAAECLAAVRAALAGGAPALLAQVPGMALYVEARVDGVDDAPDEAFDDIDAVVEAARRCCLDAGLTIEAELAVAALGVAEETPGGRTRLLAAARELERRLRSRPGASAWVRVSLTLHAAPVAVRRRGVRREMAGGPLLRAGEWAQRGGEGLTVTPAFAQGL
jgi:serine/threonine-protein kinase